MRKSVFTEELEKYKANEQEFINTAKQYNIDTDNDTIKGINRMLSQRNIKATWNDKMFTSNNQDAVWIPKSDGTREIVFNPNADTNKLLENVAVHELYHDLAKSNNGMKIKAEILEFAKTKEGYEEARLNLEEVYSQVYDKNSKEFQEIVDEEAVANILGNKLGDQKFINQLTMEKPSLSRKIYNWVVNKINVLNKATGYKNEKLFWEDIKNKFENAYREDYVSSNTTDEKYMMVGKTGAKELIKSDSKYSWLKQSYLKANQLKNNSKYNNEMIRQETGWFQDKEGNWEFEISDRNTKVKITPNSNKEYKLSDIFEAKTLYAMYPELKDMTIEFKGMKKSKNGNYNSIANKITVNNTLINDLNNLRGTLLHEIQHYIQKKEGFPTGTTILFGNEQYVNSKGETEAADTRKRMNYTLEQRKAIIPESSKKNPTHPNREAILKHKRNTIEKIAEKLYNIFGDEANEIFEENIEETDKENTKHDDRVRDNQQSHRGFNDRIEENDIEVDNEENNKISKENLQHIIYNRLEQGETNEIYEKIDLQNTEKTNEITNKLYQEHTNGIEELDNSSFSYGNLPKVKDGYTRLYRGLKGEYNPNYDRTGLDSPNGYDTLTDSYELAKRYGDKVYYIDIPTEQIGNSVIDENPNSETYGDRYLAYKDDKPASLDGIRGNEYLLYTDHDAFNSTNYKKIESSSIKPVDNQGKTLTKEQQEYFKDSKVRDENGNLLTVYHGSPNEFTIFDIDRAGSRGSWYSEGFYFTTSKELANDYASNKGKVYETYLNIKNPYIPTSDIINQDGSVTFAPSFSEDIKNRFPEQAQKYIERDGKLTGKTISYILQDNGYDGVNVGDNWIAFNSNQIKNVDNLNPTDNPDIRYSLTDNQGRELSKGQQEFFKDVSKEVKDENGELKRFYHGSNSNFTIFDKSKGSQSNSNAGVGFWFAESSEGAKKFAESVWYGERNDKGQKESKVYEVYLDLKNPKIYESIDTKIQKEELNKQLKELYYKKKGIQDEYSWETPSITALSQYLNSYKESEVFNALINNYNYKEEKAKKYIEVAKEYIKLNEEYKNIEKQHDDLGYDDSYEQFRTDIYKVAGMGANDANTGGVGMHIDNKEQVLEQYVNNLKEQGYDGIIIKNTRYDRDTMGGNNNQYVVFEPNQIKNIDNLNPTDNPDIRYSEEGEEWEQYLNDNFKSTGEGKKLKDIKLPMVEENLPYTEPEIPEETANELQTTVKDTIEVDLGEKSVLNNTINRNSIRSKESALKLANKWLNLKGNDKVDFKNSLDKYTKMSQEEILTNNSYDEIKNIVDRYSEQEIVFTEDDVKEIKKHIRNAKIKITDNLKSQITDYNDFRKSNFGKLKLAKEGTNIDVLWKELNDMYPYYFSEDIETETDMLYALSDFMSEDFSVTQRFTLDENEITEITNDVYETILDNTLNEEQRNKLIEKDNELKKMNVSDRKNIRTVESVIGTQDDYISTRAEELFEELKGLKKGVRASNELSQILNLGYRWSDIKATLSNIKWKPGEQTNSQNTNLGEIESTIKNMLNEEYENKVQELIFNDSGATDNLSKENIAKLKRFNYAKEVESLKDSLEETIKNIDKSIIEKEAEYENKKNKDTAIAQKLLGQISDLKIKKANIELDYNKRIGTLTEKVKNFDVKEETRKMSRKEYKQTLKDNISPLIEGAIKWNDKKFLGGLRYARETAQRNIVDVAGETEGNAINEYVFNPIQEHEASKNRRIKEKFKIIKDLNLDLKEQYVIDGEKVGEDDLVRRYIENSISKIDLELMGANATKIIEAADTISKMLESIYIDLNNEFKKMGLPEIEHRKDYFPHAMEEKKDTFISKLANMVGIDITNQELPTEIAGRTDEFKPNRAWNGHFLRRTGEKTDTNAIGNLERYIAGTEDILAHTEDIQKVRTLSQELKNQFTSEETQAKIEAINNNESLSDVEKDELIKEIYKREDSQLSGLVTWLDDYANVLSNKKSFADRNMERKIGRNAYTSMANIESIIAGNTVGGNASVSLTNLAPIVQATATTKGEFMVKSALDVLKNDIRTLTGNEDTSIRDMSDFLTNRFGTDSIGRKTWKDKIKKIAFKPMEIVDNFTSEVIVRAKYYENLHNGMESSEAMKNADKYASKLMADRSKGAMPIIFNEKNPMAKLITMFQVEPNNIISNYTKDMSRDSDSKGQLAYQYTKLAVGSYVFNSILMNIRGGNEVLPDPIRFVQYLIKAITGDDEEKEKAGEDMLESITGAVPFLSNVAGLLGMEDVGRIPISSALPDLTELVNLGDDEVSDEYKAQVLRDEILKPLSYFLLPTGAAQVWKTVQGLDAVANGGSYKYSKDGELKMQFPIENPDIIDYAKAGLFGKYSLDEAKTYIDSGFKTLTQKQAETYQEMNLPYAEYMEYIEGITEAKRDAKNIGESQTEAVYDYIYNLPLSDEDKNTLLNGNLGNSNTIKDDNGYIKYVDSRNKTYWYDENNNELYNRNYHKVDVSKLEELTEYSNEKDITNYGDYNSLEEFNYANNNPEKYLAITQITDYKTFNEYKSYIQDIEDEYSELMATTSSSKQKTAISNQKKAAIRKYINSLNLNKYQKLMLEKLGAGYSIKNYHSYLHSYINDLNVSKEEKETIDRVLFD